MSSIDIVQLIERKPFEPLTKLSHEYHNKFITKLKDSFNEPQQHLFVSSFYCYCNVSACFNFYWKLINRLIWAQMVLLNKLNLLELIFETTCFFPIVVATVSLFQKRFFRCRFE